METTAQIKGPTELLKVQLEDLFTTERLQALGAGKNLIGHLRHRLLGYNPYTRNRYPNWSLKTVKDLIELGKSEFEQKQWVGSGMLNLVERVLASIGLKFED